MEIELLIAFAILGCKKASALMSDAYKFAMAQAGHPLRRETFTLVFRKGTVYYNPFDLERIVRAFIPAPATLKEEAFLTANGYGMTPAMEAALAGSIVVTCVPKGTWFGKGDPVLSVTGPSFLVSWLEPLLIMLHYPIQIATAAIKGERNFTVTCSDEAAIVKCVEAAYNPPAGSEEASDPEGFRILRDVDITTQIKGEGRESCADYDHEAAKFNITMDANYRLRVFTKVSDCVRALKGDAHRAFEVGLRAATCMQQHLMVLEVCRSLGVLKTSNVYGAWKLYMIPVGTTGHEHQMRHGGSLVDDRIGYRAIRDSRPEPPSYLFDTTDPLGRGIPAMFDVIKEDPERGCSARFDSGNQNVQFESIYTRCRMTGGVFWITPNLIFEDSYNAEKVENNEVFLDSYEWPRELRMYGFGGDWVSAPSLTPHTRDVASVGYKLAMTAGRPTMKFSGSPGKKSIPGNPRILERVGTDNVVEHMIIQNELEDEFSTEYRKHGFHDPAPLDFIPTVIMVRRSKSTMDMEAAIRSVIGSTI